MPGTDLVRLTDSMLWELRRHWASGKRVAITLTEQAGRRLEGQVEGVSATGAWAKVAGVRFRPEDLLAIHRPVVMGEDSTWRGGAWHFDSLRVVPQTEQLPGIAEWESSRR